MKLEVVATVLLLGVGLLSGLCTWGWAQSKKIGGVLMISPVPLSTMRPPVDLSQAGSAKSLWSYDPVTPRVNHSESDVSTPAPGDTTDSFSFFSPAENLTSPEDSNAISSAGFASTEPNLGYENENIRRNFSGMNSTDEDVDYVSIGQHLLSEASEILDSGIWNFQKETEDGDQIYSRQLNNGNTVYRLTGVVDMPAENLLAIIYDGLANYPEWNPSLIECRVLEKINDNTDISYTVSAPGARGYVASRDFVSLRHWDLRDQTYIAATKSIDFPGAPTDHDYIRGLNGPGCMELRPLGSDPDKTEFRWLLNSKLNGWIPAYIADKAFKKFMTKYMVFLREYCKKLKQRSSDSSTKPKNVTYYT